MKNRFTYEEDVDTIPYVCFLCYYHQYDFIKLRKGWFYYGNIALEVLSYMKNASSFFILDNKEKKKKVFFNKKKVALYKMLNPLKEDE